MQFELMFKYTLVLSFFCLNTLYTSFGQNPEVSISQFNYKNNFQLELGGHGLVYTIKYERILINHPKTKTTGDAGIAYYPRGSGIMNLWLPISVKELFSFAKHHLEVGLGMVFTYSGGEDQEGRVVSWDWERFYAPNVGYRFQKPESPFLFKVEFTPFIQYYFNNEFYVFEFHPSGGIAIGWNF